MPSPWTSEPRPLDVRRLVTVLDEHGVQSILVGAIAAIAHGFSGSTFDLDIVPRVTATNLRNLAQALRDLDARVYADPRRTDLTPEGAPPEAEMLDLEDASTLRERLEWHFSTDAGLVDVLLLIDGPGDYAVLARNAETRDVGGTRVLVLSLDDLIESKETAARPKDLAALDELRRLRDLRNS